MKVEFWSFCYSQTWRVIWIYSQSRIMVFELLLTKSQKGMGNGKHSRFYPYNEWAYILNPDTTDEWSWRINIVLRRRQENLVCYFATSNIIPSFDVISETSPSTHLGLTSSSAPSHSVHHACNISLSSFLSVLSSYFSAPCGPHPSDLFASRQKSRHCLSLKAEPGPTSFDKRCI